MAIKGYQVQEITFQNELTAVKMYKFPIVHTQHTYKGKYGIKFETNVLFKYKWNLKSAITEGEQPNLCI